MQNFKSSSISNVSISCVLFTPESGDLRLGRTHAFLLPLTRIPPGN